MIRSMNLSVLLILHNVGAIPVLSYIDLLHTHICNATAIKKQSDTDQVIFSIGNVKCEDVLWIYRYRECCAHDIDNHTMPMTIHGDCYTCRRTLREYAHQCLYQPNDYVSTMYISHRC